MDVLIEGIGVVLKETIVRLKLPENVSKSRPTSGGVIQSYKRVAHANGIKPSLLWNWWQWSEGLPMFILQFGHYLFGSANFCL
jgi:hypothetical protein